MHNISKEKKNKHKSYKQMFMLSGYVLTSGSGESE